MAEGLTRPCMVALEAPQAEIFRTMVLTWVATLPMKTWSHQRARAYNLEDQVGLVVGRPLHWREIGRLVSQ